VHVMLKRGKNRRFTGKAKVHLDVSTESSGAMNVCCV
jgi:hypothetical protein